MYRTWTLLFWIGLVSCSAAEDRSPTVTVVDSAGISIVTNLELRIDEWAVDAEPLLELGTLDAGGPQQFFLISAARRLPSGEVAVLDGSREVRIFTSGGAFVRAFGGEGDGPGEYRGPGRMFLMPGDSLAIWDTRLRRLTILDSQGGVGRVVSPEGIGRRPQILTVLPDGSTLFEQEILLGHTPPEYTQQYSDYLLYGPTGELLDSLPRQPRVEVGLWGEGPLAGPRLFDEGTQFVADSTGYWIGTTKREELLRYTLQGDLARIVRWPAEDRAVGDDAAALSLREALEALPPGADREAFSEVHLSRGIPERYPSHGPILVDQGGSLWVQEFERPGHEGPSLWRVFETDGTLTARVRVPGGHRVLDIGQDYLLAVGRDEYDVEYVRLFGLTRSPTEGLTTPR